MRIGVIWHENNNTWYRAIDPLRAMEQRGHEVSWPATGGTGRQPLERLMRCDVVHVYRSWEPDAREFAARLVAAGIGVVYDNDDDYTLVPPSALTYRQIGGLKGEQIHRAVMRVARSAHVVTTTSETLAERYRKFGLERVVVIPNQLIRNLYRPQNRHAGVRIGWVAGVEHVADAEELGIRPVLRRLLDEHPDLSVESFGVDLRLQGDYHHTEMVEFAELPRRMARWDIGIAPLADIPFNRMRSDIKLKEYAASGLPWLASPVGPYAKLGEDQGGRLVADGEWYDALTRLVTSKRERKKLAKRGRKWAKSQTIEATADAWEAVYREAAEAAASAQPAAVAAGR